ncbi:MAG: DNA/RNA non-specific endonuclease [Pirellulales bacterium]
MIALAAASGLPQAEDGRAVRFRVAANAARINPQASLNVQQQSWFDEHNPLGMAKSDHPGNWTIVARQGYTLAHNNVDLIADWVSFHLTRDYVNATEKRPGTDAFKPDPVLLSGRRAELADYEGWKNVYDRGHQCASADSKGRGRDVIRESFLLSNMTPQASKLNQHRWRLLEARIQKLAKARKELWVITGPVFKDDDGDGIIEYFVIGEHQVAVPTHYFKIVLARDPSADGKWEAICFLFPNEKVTEPDEEFLVSIDDVESLTGYDFLSNLPDEQESPLEAASAQAIWSDE